MIYQPKEDSYLLEWVVKAISKGKRVLDIGCGSGIQMGAALSSGALEVKGVDISKDVVQFCKKKGLDVVRSDLFSEVSGKFDLIIFNPPYLPKDEREDEESALATSGGVKGDEVIVRFLSEVEGYLSKKGVVLLVVSSLTPLQKINGVLKKGCMKKKVVASEIVFMERLEVWDIRKA